MSTKNFLLITTLSLLLFSCEREASFEEEVAIADQRITEIVKGNVTYKPKNEGELTFIRGGFYGYTYNTFDTEDYQSYLNFFIWEAAQHGKDLSYVLDNEIVFIEDTTIPVIATAAGVANDSKVYIVVNPELFSYENRTKLSKIAVMFHEFGHDILNLPHTDDQKSLMYKEIPHNLTNSYKVMDQVSDLLTKTR